MKTMFILTTHSPEETRRAGRRIGEGLRGGETIALSGPLGAGKTVFAQGVAEGLGVREPLTSPTYLIHRQYEGRLLMHHFDFYRLETADDLESVGFHDFQAEKRPSVIVAEWAQRFPDDLEEPLIEIDMASGDDDGERRIHVRLRGMEPGDWQVLGEDAP